MAQSLDLTYRLLAARYVRRQVKQLAEQLDGVCEGEDIEFIHRARVASRRLRAAMRMFRECFQPKLFKRWRNHIRRLTAGLGDARDKDVQIELLSSILGQITDKACAPGIARLAAQFERQRERLQPTVVKAVKRLRRAEVLEEMQAVGKSILAEQDGKQAETVADSPAARALAGRHILQRLEEMLPYEESLDDPGNKRSHHAMRIAAKRLRYTLEIAKPVYAGPLDRIIEATKKVQSLLGDIHDCDVWLSQLGLFAESQRARVRKYFGREGRFTRLQSGIQYLERDRCKRRQQVFEELVEYWRQLKAEGFWENLVRVVEGTCDAVPPSPPLAISPPPPVATSEQPAGSAANGSPDSSTKKAVVHAAQPNGDGPHERLASEARPAAPRMSLVAESARR